MGRKSDAKEKLLDVAFDLIWQQSYGSVSVDQICDRASVKKGSFYHFFRSKCDLAVAAYERHWQRNQPHYDRIFSPLVPPLDRLRDYCRIVYDCQRAEFARSGRVLGCPFASVGCEVSTQNDDLRRKANEMFLRMCQYLENALRDAFKEGLIESQDFSQLARAIFSLTIGMLLQAKVKNDPESLKELEPQVFTLLRTKPAVVTPRRFLPITTSPSAVAHRI